MPHVTVSMLCLLACTAAATFEMTPTAAGNLVNPTDMMYSQASTEAFRSSFESTQLAEQSCTATDLGNTGRRISKGQMRTCDM